VLNLSTAKFSPPCARSPAPREQCIRQQESSQPLFSLAAGKAEGWVKGSTDLSVQIRVE